jgi:hypothetical protein
MGGRAICRPQTGTIRARRARTQTPRNSRACEPPAILASSLLVCPGHLAVTEGEQDPMRMSAAFVGCVCVALLLAPGRARAGVELGVGWEGNATRGSAYTSSAWAFDGGPGSAIVLRVSESAFYYRLNDGFEETRESSLGGSLEVALRFCLGEAVLTAGPGIEVRQEVSSFSSGDALSEWGFGPTFSLDAYAPLDSITYGSLAASYSHASRYFWVRSALFEQEFDRRFEGPVGIALGIELTGQGNDEIHLVQVGAVIEIDFADLPGVLSLRAGHSRLESDGFMTTRAGYFGAEFSYGFSTCDGD